MAKNDYSHGDHMAQLGKVTGLLEAVSKMQNQLVKEQERLKILEQKHLLEKIKNEEGESAK